MRPVESAVVVVVEIREAGLVSCLACFPRARAVAYLGQVIGRAIGASVIGVARIGRVRVGVAVCGVRHGRCSVCTVSERCCVSRT